jgi:hypothetical protein
MDKVMRTGQVSQHPGQTIISLLIAVWLMVVQPGMSYYSLINPDVHAEIDAVLYGQSPSGETLPGHQRQSPHQHPMGLGMSIPNLTLVNPFDAAIYDELAAAASRPAVFDHLNEVRLSVRSIVIEPPLQPPRTSL